MRTEKQIQERLSQYRDDLKIFDNKKELGQWIKLLEWVLS